MAWHWCCWWCMEGLGIGTSANCFYHQRCVLWITGSVFATETGFRPQTSFTAFCTKPILFSIQPADSEWKLYGNSWYWSCNVCFPRTLLNGDFIAFYFQLHGSLLRCCEGRLYAECREVQRSLVSGIPGGIQLVFPRNVFPCTFLVRWSCLTFSCVFWLEIKRGYHMKMYWTYLENWMWHETCCLRLILQCCREKFYVGGEGNVYFGRLLGSRIKIQVHKPHCLSPGSQPCTRIELHHELFCKITGIYIAMNTAVSSLQTEQLLNWADDRMSTFQQPTSDIVISLKLTKGDFSFCLILEIQTWVQVMQRWGFLLCSWAKCTSCGQFT